MGFLLAFAVAAAAGQTSFSIEAELGPGREVELKGERVVYDAAERTLTATGRTSLRMEHLSVRADSVFFDQEENRAVAEGNVLFASGTLAAVANKVEVDIESMHAAFEGGLLMSKKGVPFAQLADAQTSDELKGMGQTALTVTGDKIAKLEEGEYEIDGLSFTPCDCNPLKPNWHVEASSGNVRPEDRAILHWPVIYVRKVPVFAFPWLYLPLSDRKTGLLVPRPSGGNLTGFSLEQPIFITAGPSYDFTLTPGYAVGASSILYPSASAPSGPIDSNVRTQQPFGIRGPRLGTEFRYVPSAQTSGRVELNLLYDLLKVRDPLNPNAYTGGQKTMGDDARGFRGSAQWQHAQELGRGFHDRIDLNLVSDGYYVKDLTADLLMRENQYLRSNGVLYRRTDDSYSGLEVTVRQDLRWGYRLSGDDRAYAQPGAPIAHGPQTLQRVPALRWALPERSLGGPFYGGIDAELVRIAPLFARFGDEGSDGFFDAASPDANGTQGNRRFDAGEREARNRLDIHPRLHATFPLGDFGKWSPYLAYRQSLYLGEVTGSAFGRGYPMGGFRLTSEISRDYGREGTVRHSISPRVEFRYIPKVWGLRTFLPYDEVDQAVPAQGATQAVIAISQKLLVREGAAARELLRLDVGKDFDFRAKAREGDAFARLAGFFPPFSFDGIYRYSLVEKRPTQISSQLAYDDGKRFAAYARVDHLLLDGSDHIRSPIDTLFGPAPSLPECAANQPETACRAPAELISGGARYLLPLGLSLAYEAAFQRLKTMAQGEPFLNRFQRQTFTVAYAPACDCWRLDARFTFYPVPPPYQFRGPEFGLSLTIAKFGTLGTSR